MWSGKFVIWQHEFTFGIVNLAFLFHHYHLCLAWAEAECVAQYQATIVDYPCLWNKRLFVLFCFVWFGLLCQWYPVTRIRTMFYVYVYLCVMGHSSYHELFAKPKNLKRSRWGPKSYFLFSHVLPLQWICSTWSFEQLNEYSKLCNKFLVYDKKRWPCAQVGADVKLD